MEPLSILGAAAAISNVAGKAYELGSFIRELCQGARNVDGRVRRLESALTELARACEHVQSQFESMPSSTSTQNPSLVWDNDGTMAAAIERQVSDCLKTLKELRRLLIDLRRGSSSFFSRASRYMKLQDRIPQIDDFSTRAKAHTDALHMSLQIVIIKIALATPDYLLRQLAVALEDLRARLTRIETKGDATMSRKDVEGYQGGLLLNIARDTLRSGTTLYETSIAGSEVDNESVADDDRASYIRKWADNVDSLHSIRDRNSGIYQSETASVHVARKKESSDTLAKDSFCDNTPARPEDMRPEGQPDGGSNGSDSDTSSIAIAVAAHDNPLACGMEGLSISNQPADKTSPKKHLTPIDGVGHISVDNNGFTRSSPHSVPGCAETSLGSRHLDSKSSSTDSTDRSPDDESTTGAADPQGSPVPGEASDQCTPRPAEAHLRTANTTKRVSFRYPMETSDPLNRSTREKLIRDWKIQIGGRLEELICTGEHVQPAILSELVAMKQVASIVPQSATTTEPQERRSRLALLLAVCFRDTYLIAPLVKHGFSPNADVWVNDDEDCGYRDPLGAALALRSEPIIEALLNNGAELHCELPLVYPLLFHGNLLRYPPPSIGSIKRVIDLLMPARPSQFAKCFCRDRMPVVRRACDSLPWRLLRDACNMPPQLSHYGLPLVTYLLEYLVSHKKSSRDTSNSPLYNAILSNSVKVVKFLFDHAEESLVHTWLRPRHSEPPLSLAIRRAKNYPENSIDIVRMLLESGADLNARAPRHYQTVTHKRTTLRDIALRSQRADLKALVRNYSK